MSRLSALSRVRQFITQNPKSSAAAAVGTLGGLGALPFLDPVKKETDKIPPIVPPPSTTAPQDSQDNAGTQPPSSKDSADSVNKPGPTGMGELKEFYRDILPGLVSMYEQTGERATARDVRAQLALLEATEKIGLEKTLEQSRRQVELENIKAWRDITTAQYNANAQMGLGLAEIAYRATQPNPGVLTATQGFARAGMEAFGGKLG